MKLIFFALLTINLVLAFPHLEPCNPANWIINNAFGPMGTLQAGSAPICSITGVPATYDPCGEYKLTVTTSQSMGHKIYSNIGAWLSGGVEQVNPSTSQICRHTPGETTQTTSEFVWKAPPGETEGVLFKSLCGTTVGGPNLLFFTVSTLRNNTANPFSAGCPPPTNSPTTASPTSQAPSLSPTTSPTLAPRVGPDGSPPANNNWRNNIAYNDLIVSVGTRVQFLWNVVASHSIHQFKNQADFDACNFTNGVDLVGPSNGGNFILDLPPTAGTVWIGCRVGTHCTTLKQKVRIFTEFPVMSPDGVVPPPSNNWRLKSYNDLPVERGQEIKFTWDGFHSLVQFANKDDFDECALDKATVVVDKKTNGSYVFRASRVGNFWFGCSVGFHCADQNMKIKIVVSNPELGLDGAPVPIPASNWKLQSYQDLTVPQGMDVRFNWAGTHSVVQLPDQNAFDACAPLTGPNSVVLAPSTGPTTFALKTDNKQGQTMFIGCGVGNHCSTSNMKIKVTVGKTLIGPDAVFPVQKNNWRKKVFSDLRVKKNTDIQFLWDAEHSIVQFLNQADFDSCNINASIELTAPVTKGKFTFSFTTPNTTILLGCKVDDHCSAFGQKLRVFVEADAPNDGAVPPPGVPQDPTDGAPAAAPANGGGGEADVGVIAGSVGGLLIGAAMLLMYRRSRSRSRSSDEMKRGFNYNDVEKGNGQYQTTAAAKPAANAYPSYQVSNYNNTATASPVPESTYQTPASAIPSVRISFFQSSTTPSAAPVTNAVPATVPEDMDSSVGLGGSSSFGDDTQPSSTKFGEVLRASASSLKKTFREKRDIAMKSFRPIVSVDGQLPPPPPEPTDPQDSGRKTFKPPSMYGGQPLPIMMSSVPKQSTQSVSSSVTKPSNSMAGIPSRSAMQQRESSAVPSSSASSRQFQPTASEISSPDNFTGISSKIKQSVRGGKSNAAAGSMGSVVPPSDKFSDQQMSANNPAYSIVQEEPREMESGDEYGAGKPYGSVQNHPLFNRKLSV